MSQVFVWPIQVYYEDTDAGGVVYHSRYLNFLERARTEWLRSIGYEQDKLAQQDGVLFAVCRLEIDYLRPARFNQRLLVHSIVSELKRVSLKFNQEIRLAHDDNQLLTTAQVQIACIDTENYRPCPIPESLSRIFRNGL